MRRHPFLLTAAALISMFVWAGAARAAKPDQIPCYCRFKNASRLVDAEEKLYCPDEVGAMGLVENTIVADIKCNQLCASLGEEAVEASDVDSEGYGQPYNMTKDEKKYCVFGHATFSEIAGWNSNYDNCKNPLNAIGGPMPSACSFCFCKYKSTSGACAGKTSWVHATGYPANCPALCAKLNLDGDGPATTNYDDKCDYKSNDQCAKPVNGGSGACKASLDAIQTAKENADLLKLRVTTRGSVVTMPLPLSSTSIPGVIGRIINTVVGMVGAIALLMFVWGGLQWMLAAGSTEKVAKAKKTIVWATLGLIAIFSSYAVLNFVITAVSK